MDPRPRSPSRRHILSSINPEGNEAINDNDHRQGQATEDAQQAEDGLNRRARRLHLKDPTKRRHRHRHQRHDSRSRSRSPHRSHRHHHRSHRHRHDRSPTPPNPHAPPPLSPNKAFLESLFDAMADDEGAEYWQSVYGEPVHTLGGGRAALDAMGEEDYAAHVRARMWERTEEGREDARRKARNQALREEQEERARRRQKRQRQQRDKEFMMDDEVAATLARGEERKKQREGRKMWQGYVERWTQWDGAIEALAWPVEGYAEWGVRDVSEEKVRAFLAGGLQNDDEGRAELVLRLREERVRWHPDKMQQRLGGSVAEGVMRDVTAVFQVIDKIWGEVRG